MKPQAGIAKEAKEAKEEEEEVKLRVLACSLWLAACGFFHNVTMSFTIRLATRADEPAIQNVIRTVYDELGWAWHSESYHRDLYDIDAAYFSHGGYFWVAEVDGKVVGTTALEVFDRFPGEEGQTTVNGVIRGAGCDCSIERLYVLASARGLGVGGALWRQTADKARELGCKRIEIWTDKRLEDAHKMYDRYGAKRVGERLCHDPEQSPEWGMVYDL